jgi:hypothetical protein
MQVSCCNIQLCACLHPYLTAKTYQPTQVLWPLLHCNLPHQRALPMLIVPPAHRPTRPQSSLVARCQSGGAAYRRRPTVSLVSTSPVHCLTAMVKQVKCPHRRCRQHRATPTVRACASTTLDEFGTGQGCGCYLLGPVAAYWSSVRRAKRPSSLSTAALVLPTLQRVISE